MTDRETTVPAELTRPLNFRPQVDLLVGDLSPNVLVEPAQRGDFPPMPLTLTPRPPLRSAAADEPSVGSLRAWLTQIASSTANLAAFAPAVLPDSHHRNPLEAEASSRAAGCPDLFAIHAPEQTARERVIADIAWATDSERVLVLSPDATTADRVVERLAKVEVAALRALADDENPARPSPVVTRSTSASVAGFELERLRIEMATTVSCAAERLNAIGQTLSAQAQIEDFTNRCIDIDREIAEVNVRREHIERQVRLEAVGTEATAFASTVHRCETEREATVDGIIRKRHTTLDLHKQKEAFVADLRKQTSESTAAVARKSGFFSRLLGRAKSNSPSVESDKQLQDAERELSEIATTLSTLQQELQIASAKLEEERESLIRAEVAIRRAEPDSRLALLTTEFERVKTELENATRTLGPNPPTPTELAAAKELAEREFASAQLRLAEQRHYDRDLARRTLAGLRVVVGTPGSLQCDPVFESDPHGLHPLPPFGLLVLDRAEELTENDFFRLAKLAARWVLVGDIAVSPESQAYARGNSAHHLQGFGRNGRNIELLFTARLARVLDRERWTYEADRLVCRLEHIGADNRRSIVREPLLDSPDIELRFITNSEGEPILVEVAFPAATSIAAAKSLLYRQLGEILIRPSGDVAWNTTADTITASWALADRGARTGEAVWIDLEPGIREKVVGAGSAAFSAAISFDTALGWNEAKAGKWLQDHIPTESPSRFATISRR
jgi:hypothetical protein